MSKTIITLTDQNFDKYFTTSKYLVIDFWAPWCEPCKDFTKVFQEVADTTDENFCFASINVDEEKKLALDFSVRSVPTLAIIQNQVMVFYQSGVLPKKALLDLLKQAQSLPDIPFAE